MLVVEKKEETGEKKVLRSISLYQSKYDLNKEFLKLVGGITYSSFASQVNTLLSDAIRESGYDPENVGNLAERSLLWNSVIRKTCAKIEKTLT